MCRIRVRRVATIEIVFPRDYGIACHFLRGAIAVSYVYVFLAAFNRALKRDLSRATVFGCSTRLAAA